eukprot:TRINITY_DN27263_c0_g1_i1.p1 TRINITY_DN27263_c0_g1~~TRINITY_DN27263_c0_g1_i1.p1  ORF type:complete len:436 (+),score=230.08 TRINITY_DN27263_c0_g1_i1:65-1372(+)
MPFTDPGNNSSKVLDLSFDEGGRNSPVSFPKSKIKFVLFEGVHQKAVDMLQAEGFTVELLAGALAGDELVEKLKDARVVGVRSKTKLTAEVLKKCPKLMAVGCFCIGTDQTDLVQAEKQGIPVFNSPFSNSRSVAELIIGTVVSLSRRLTEQSHNMHNNSWQKTAAGCFEVRGKVLGIVGYGHIGSQLSVLAEAMGMRVIYKDRKKVLPLGNAVQKDTLDELLEQADYVTMHVPDTEETRYMIKAEQIKKMKKGSYLLNASRGKVVDLDALRDAMVSKHLAGCMVDVYPKEPAKNGLIKEQGVEIPLTGLSNCILTPHIGGSTKEAQEAIGVEVAIKMANFINKGDTDGAVNFPNITPPALKSGRHRIANVHKNVPGVLRQINNVLGDAGNVAFQTVQTEEHIGYLIVDVDSAVSDTVLNSIRDLTESERTRRIF